MQLFAGYAHCLLVGCGVLEFAGDAACRCIFFDLEYGIEETHPPSIFGRGVLGEMVRASPRSRMDVMKGVICCEPNAHHATKWVPVAAQLLAPCRRGRSEIRALAANVFAWGWALWTYEKGYPSTKLMTSPSARNPTSPSAI